MRYRICRRFTLVEMLVVVATVCLLVSLLMPALNQAVESAKQASCMSNQRQVGIAFSLYASDNHGRIPKSSRDNALSSAQKYRNWPAFYYSNHSRGGKSAPYVPSGGGYLEDEELIHCVKNFSPTGGSYVGIYGLYYSYASILNATSDGDFYRNWSNGEPSSSSTHHSLTYYTVNVLNASRIFLMGCTSMSARPERFGIGYEQFCATRFWGGGSADSQGLWRAHNNFVNGLYLDGHVESCGETDLMSVGNNNRTDGGPSGIFASYSEDGIPENYLP